MEFDLDAVQPRPCAHTGYKTAGYKILRAGGYRRGDEENIERATELLRKALALFQEGGAPKTANRVRFALASAYGAQRHVRHRHERSRRDRCRRTECAGKPPHSQYAIHGPYIRPRGRRAGR